jgi:LmbE family N-acetylglucosaminyl deacetylase
MQVASDNVVLALMAHPDDAEILCGAPWRSWRGRAGASTWRRRPRRLRFGTLGPEEIAAIRRQEARSAAGLLGGTFHCLERRDLQVRYDAETLVAACGLLRAVCPRLLIAHSPTDYQVDHEQISLVARAAAFNAPIPNAPTRRASANTGGMPTRRTTCWR